MKQIFSILFIVFIIISFDYGITVDEHYHQLYGEKVTDYYLSGFKDKAYLEYINLSYFGSAFSLIVGVTQKILKSFEVNHPYEARHILTGIFAFFLFFGFFNLLKLFSIKWLPHLGLILLLFLPPLFGHSFSNSADIPFAAMFLWALYFLIKFFIFNEKDFKTTLKFAFFTGFAISIRYGGMLLFFYIFIAFILNLLIYKPKTFSYFKDLIIKGTIFFIVTYIIIFIFWPTMHEYPLTGILRSHQYFTNYAVNIEEFFIGKDIFYKDFPWYYLPLYISIQTPLFILLTFIIGLFLFSLSYIPFFKEKLALFNIKEKSIIALSIFWFLFPIIFIILNKSTVYNTSRHVIFALPGMVLISSIGILFIYNLICKIKILKISSYVILGLYLLFMSYQYITLHPYENIFYNSLVGGVNGAKDKYLLDYWGGSIKELVKNTEAKLTKGKFYKYSMANIATVQAEYYFNEFMFPTSLDTYDCIMTSVSKSSEDRLKREHPELIEFAKVERQGITLARTLCKPTVF